MKMQIEPLNVSSKSMEWKIKVRKNSLNNTSPKEKEIIMMSWVCQETLAWKKSKKLIEA